MTADQSDAGRNAVIEEEVEAVAKAMYKARHDGLSNCYPWDDTDLDHDHPDCRPALYRDAKAAIKAIRALTAAPAETVGYHEAENLLLSVANGETEKANALVDELRHERNVLQKISTKWADEIERLEAFHLPAAEAIRKARDLLREINGMIELGRLRVEHEGPQRLRMKIERLIAKLTAALALIGEG